MSRFIHSNVCCLFTSRNDINDSCETPPLRSDHGDWFSMGAFCCWCCLNYEQYTRVDVKFFLQINRKSLRVWLWGRRSSNIIPRDGCRVLAFVLGNSWRSLEPWWLLDVYLWQWSGTARAHSHTETIVCCLDAKHGPKKTTTNGWGLGYSKYLRNQDKLNGPVSLFSLSRFD